MRRRRPAWAGALGLALVAVPLGAATATGQEAPPADEVAPPADEVAPPPADQPGEHTETAAEIDYRGTIEVIEAEATSKPGEPEPDEPETVSGLVFNDRNRDGVHQPRREPGIAGIRVSNGREVVVTDEGGRYELPARDDMSVFVTKPSNYAVPIDDDNVPQMSYEHKPRGSRDELRFGGLEPTGPLPAAINFPMVPVAQTDEFSCAVLGDTQTYSGNELGYARDSAVLDLLSEDLSRHECQILLGDVMGDDLDLLPRLKDVMSATGLPQYYVHGNHDIDFDATDDADSSDTWRREYGPRYYSFDIGQVHFVVLENVVYPCTEEDAEAGRPTCGDPDNPVYNGRVDDVQMEWLANDLAHVPDDKLVVLNHHIPLVSFVDSQQVIHQTDNATDIYALLEGRPALSLSGHTHTIEQLLPGDSYAGWQEAVGVDEVPFHHLVAGAVSGQWYTGDLDRDGVPMAIGRQGEPRGYFTFAFDGADYQERFHATGQGDRQMNLSFDSPQFRTWFEELFAWSQDDPPTSDGVPPVTIGDLEDTKLFTPDDLAEGVSLVANVWAGSGDSEVTVHVDGVGTLPLERTQDADGEAIREGTEFTDPYAAVRQLQVSRYAFESTSGDADAQGWQAYRGAQFGPAAPQGIAPSAIARRSSHQWRAELPTDLPVGTHVADVQHVDRHGNVDVDTIVFEVRDERPDRFWRDEPWSDGS